LGLPRDQGRKLIDGKDGVLWRIEPVPGKGSPKGLFPLSHPSAAKKDEPAEPSPARGSQAGISAARAQSGPQKYPAPGAASEAGLRGAPFSRRPEATRTEPGWEEVS
jgi:hypothetical protein